jgi:site-specific DNA recombinase
VDGFVIAVMRARLAQPDLEKLLAVEQNPEVRKLAAEVHRLRGRLVKIEDDYDAELIDGRRFAVATEKTRAALATAEAALTRSNSNAAAVLLLRRTDPVEAFNAAPLMIQRAVIEALCTIRLYSAPRGRKAFDPETIHIEWLN